MYYIRIHNMNHLRVVHLQYATFYHHATLPSREKKMSQHFLVSCRFGCNYFFLFVVTNYYYYCHCYHLFVDFILTSTANFGCLYSNKPFIHFPFKFFFLSLFLSIVSSSRHHRVCLFLVVMMNAVNGADVQHEQCTSMYYAILEIIFIR